MRDEIETSLCARGHTVWWAELDAERVPFVRFTRGYALPSEEGRAAARALRECFRLHSDICECEEFSRPRRERLGGMEETER